MILSVQKLEMSNFMTNREESIEFPEQGIFLLWGPSGAGKSSLLESIGFALYGMAATRAQTLDELRHELYPDEDLGVRLTLGLGDGKQVQIFRGIEKGRSIAWMVDADGTLLEGVRPVSEKVADLMGKMDGPTFFSTYFAQQGELDALIRMPGGGRRKFVQRMLGISLLDQVNRGISKDLARAKDRLAFLDEQMPKEGKEELTEQLARARQALGEQQELVARLKVELAASETQGKALRERLDGERKQSERHAALQPLIETLERTRIPALEQSMIGAREAVTESEAAGQRLQAASQDRAAIGALQQEAERLSAAEGALQMLERLRTELAAATRSATDRDATLAAMPEPAAASDTVEALREQTVELRSEWNTLDARLKEAADSLRKLEEEEKCFTCLRPLDDSSGDVLTDLKTHASHLEERANLVKEQGISLAKRLASAQAIQEKNESLQRTREQARTLAEEARRQVAAVAARLETAEQEAKGGDSDRLQVVRRELAALAESVAKFESDEKLDAAEQMRKTNLLRAEKELKEERVQLETAKAEFVALRFDVAAFAQLEQEYDAARKTYTHLSDKIISGVETVGRLEGEAKEASEKLTRYDQTIADRKQSAEQSVLFKRLDGSMKDFKQHMIGGIRPSLEIQTSQHLSELTDGSMPGVRIDEEYDLAIKRHGEFRRIGLCSGGEKARAAFALRLALTQLVSQRTDTPVGFMVFDEIFGSQDEEHRKAILDALVHLRSVYPQTFLISHEEMLKDSPLVNLIVSVPDAESENRITVASR